MKWRTTAGAVVALLVLWPILAHFRRPAGPAAVVPSRSDSSAAKIQFADSPAPNKSFHGVAGINMIWIAPGDFQMGDTTGHGDSDEQPVHAVRLTTGYWLGESVVTQGQWKAVMGDNPSHSQGDSLPVESVSWHDAAAFCQKLTEREHAAGHLPAGVDYRLPTEAQWEYACRAGTTGDYAGDLDAMAWDDSNSKDRMHEVKTKRPNAWGLYDMHGNAWEWCADVYGSYAPGSQVDPKGAASGAERVFRGGAWDFGGKRCRSANRYKGAPNGPLADVSFRLAAVSSPGTGTSGGLGAASAGGERPWPAGVEIADGARAGEERPFVIAPGVNVTMCWVPAGTFTMGSDTTESGHSGDEGPVKVRLSRGFWLAKTECTQQSWFAVMGENPSHFQGADLPVEEISWNDCHAFLGKLRKPGGGWYFALPTEAQWEYACRAGSSELYSGDLDALAWYAANSGGTTHPVGTKQANPWGLQDMPGNVWEWCRDAYDSNLPGGIDPEVKTGADRVIRGGSWFNAASFCRSPSRLKFTPDIRFDHLGCRLAAIPPSAPAKP